METGEANKAFQIKETGSKKQTLVNYYFETFDAK